jgi:hypothetical protein
VLSRAGQAHRLIPVLIPVRVEAAAHRLIPVLMRVRVEAAAHPLIPAKPSAEPSSAQLSLAEQSTASVGRAGNCC